MFRLKHRHLYVRWLFLRLLSICFFSAFLSMAVQITGLFGSNGIIPLKTQLEMLSRSLGATAVLNYPSIFFFNADDGFLQAICYTGAFVSGLAFLGTFTAPCLALSWLLYLSIVSVGQDFMGFQWDSLLLETGLLAVFFAPWSKREIAPFDRLRFESQNEVSLFFLFLLRLLCFKLMLLSGLCKLASQDETWRDLSALSYHYYTQPLPTPIAWFLQKLPSLIQRISTALVFVIELILPLSLLSFFRIARIFSATAFIVLMLVIMLSGNYAFFNLLTIAVCLTLLDDRAVLTLMPRSFRLNHKVKPLNFRQSFSSTLRSSVAALAIASVSISCLCLCFIRDVESLPFAMQLPLFLLQPIRSFNSYGLFAVMTRTRKEIIVEGSNDGKTWLAYEFRFKPGDIHRAPPIVAPHQPRLDWQMWFAALAPGERSLWFDSFMKKLLEGSPEVLSLLSKNPFPDKAPLEIRAKLYDYKFSDWNALLTRGQWWQRREESEYYPASSLEDFRNSR
ncbi:MAG: lipase maturation factor family protein [Candidatus Obscuribacterales bacterium]|nr:lipase maturation factor family protein [Candidatus Obscuribacterales bacterium]